MVTKTKTIEESAPKAVKEASTAPTELKKSTAKTKTATIDQQDPTPVKAAKSVKSAKPESIVQSQQQSETPDSLQNNTPQIIETTDIETPSKVVAVVEEPSLQAPSSAVTEQKWLEIKLILEKLKEDTLREIKKSVKNGAEALAVIEPGGDIYDQASSERDRELGLLLGDREREKIHSIDEALLRIDEGEYGICEECDEDIPLGRLKAMPFTRHCVKCKSDLEKLQAQTKRVEEERAYREIPLGAEDEES